MARELRTMTVGELIEALQGWDENTLVTFASDYGDHGHTQQAHMIEGDLEEREIQTSAYSVSGWALVEDDEDEDEDPNEHLKAEAAPRVLVIR